MIEAVYTFPLSAKAAVNDMLIKVGDRVVNRVINLREEARRIYEEARDKGKLVPLHYQECRNIFTQSVANIMSKSVDIIHNFRFRRGVGVFSTHD